MIEVRDLIRRKDEQHTADPATAVDLRRLEGKLSGKDRGAWKPRVAEVMKALEQAPEAIRERFAAWKKAMSAPGPPRKASSPWRCPGFVVGSEAATSDLEGRRCLWQARDLVANTSAARRPRGGRNSSRSWTPWTGPPKPMRPEGLKKLDLLSKMVLLMPPPLHDPADEAGKTLVHKVVEDQNDEPTEYAVRLPPEYHPLRSYPAIVVLHGDQGPESTIEPWAAEAAHRGYIVIAPGVQPARPAREYRYTPSEHAAVELALRDARRRYAIDSDRVFLAGQLTGGNMAWDFALAPSRPVRRGDRDLRVPGQVRSPATCPITNGCHSTS